jgi:hypothetical protein
MFKIRNYMHETRKVLFSEITHNDLHVVNTLAEYAEQYIEDISQVKLKSVKSSYGDFSSTSIRLIGVKYPSNIHLSFSGAGNDLTGTGKHFFVTETGAVLSRNVSRPEVLPIVQLNQVIELTDGDEKQSFKIVLKNGRLTLEIV